HGHIPADGQKTEGISGLLPLLLEKLWPHSHGELVDFDVKQFRKGKVSGLVGQDEKTEKQDGYEDADGCSPLNKLGDILPCGMVCVHDVGKVEVYGVLAGVHGLGHELADLQKMDF